MIQSALEYCSCKSSQISKSHSWKTRACEIDSI